MVVVKLFLAIAILAIQHMIIGYAFQMDAIQRLYDMFGDGWGLGNYNLVRFDGITYSSGTLSNGNYSLITNVGVPLCSVFGCIDPNAQNYNASANIDDGTCTYVNCISSVSHLEDFESGTSNNNITLSSGSNSSSSVSGLASKSGSYGWHGEDTSTSWDQILPQVIKHF